MAVSSRVSPYPLRSCRNKKQNESESGLLESVNVSELEDVRCVICMEPPHNAVLLQCSSFSKGCRAYMCDTSARHSNCYKQFRRNKTKRCRNGCKTLRCPYCRGEVTGITKSTTVARRFMNARPRSCSVEKCGFSGTYSQLNTHLKVEHPGLKLPKLKRESEYVEMVSDRQRWESEQRLLAASLRELPPYPITGINYNIDAFVRAVLLRVSIQQRLSRSQV